MRKSQKRQSKKIITGGAAFQNRKTFADYAVDNFNAKQRYSFYQQIIILVKHKISGGGKLIKKEIEAIVRQCNDNTYNEHVTGLCLYYKDYSVYCLKASEETMGILMQKLEEIEKEIFEMAKILVVANNIRKVPFDRVVWRTGEPPKILDKLNEHTEEGGSREISILIKRMRHLVKEIRFNLDEKVCTYEDEVLDNNDYKNMIAISRIEFILKSKNLNDLSHYTKMFHKLPILQDFNENVWPIPYDYTPFGLFTIGKYDVNLTFKDADKQT